jgi:4-amino-4-deoxy-L-arabinose transferase-like glycosyltransferase
MLVKAGIAYLISRLCVAAGAAIVAAEQSTIARAEGLERPKNAVNLMLRVLTSWDGAWYYRIIRTGYPGIVPENITYFDPQARAAFFPVYPMLVRAVDVILPGGDVLAGVTVNFLVGAGGVYVTGLLARDLFGERIAYRTMLLMAFFPGSFVLSFTYSEATLILVAAASLLFLLRRQWVAAGVLAAIGTATRPNGLALVAACAVASFLAIRQRREWRSLIAPILAPLGFIAFQLHLRLKNGEWVWFRVQREAWDEGTSFGLTAIRNTVEAIQRPLSSPTDLITALSFFGTLVMLWIMWKRRLPWPVMAFVLVVLAMMILPNTVTARPRFLYTAFPLLISVAAWWPEDREEAWGAAISLCTAGLVTLTALYGVLGAIP